MPAEPTIDRRVHWMHSIKVKTWLGVLLIAIVPLVVMSSQVYGTLVDITRDLVIKNNLQAFQRVKAEVDRYVDTYVDLVHLLQRDARLADPTSLQAAAALRQMQQGYDFIDRLVLVASAGIVAPFDAGAASVTPLTAAELHALGQSAPVTFGTGLFYVKAPIAGATPPVVVFAGVSFMKLRKTLENIALGTSFQFYVVSRDGANLLGRPEFPAELARQLVGRPSGTYEVRPPGARMPTQVAVVLPILQYGLRVLILQDADEVYAVLYRIKANSIMAITIIAILAFLLASWFSVRLTRPITAIAERATEIAAGNMRVSVKVDRHDEIGFLAGSFNAMTARVRKKVFELSALYKISDIINHAPTYQKALDDTLAHIVTIFLATRGSIMLLGDSDDQLRLKSVRFFGQIDDEAAAIGPIQEKLALFSGEGIAGRVVQTGEAILSRNCREDERFKPYPAGTEVAPPNTLLCVPLVIKGQPFGVINLADRADAASFSEDDRELLMTIANQLAISIDNAKLHELAITDGMTQLFIHRYFQIKLDDEIKRALRYKEFFSLILFDIDHFKKFNDTYGHQQGDTVLREVARLVKEAVRSTDIPCRYGGEEFAIILPHTTAEQSMIFAERLRQRIEAHQFPGQSEPLHVTISLGVAEFPRQAQDKARVIRITDLALYHCKARGRNCASIYDEGMAQSAGIHA